MSPISYLRPNSAICSHQIEGDLKNGGFCKGRDSDSLLSDQSFLGISGIQVRANKSGSSLAKLDVRYFYAKNIQVYLNSKENIELEDQVDNIDSVAERFKKENVEENKIEVDEPLGKPVHFDSITNTCENVVLEVKYNIHWSGETIPKIEVEIILGNIDLRQGEHRSLTQFFQTTFTHVENDQDFDFETNLNPGIYFGQPIVSGILDENDFFEENPQV